MNQVNKRFLQWCKLHAISPGQFYIGRGHLHLEDWAELRLKAYAGRVFTSFMAICLQALLEGNDSPDNDLALISVACAQLSNWMIALEHAPINMTNPVATYLFDGGMALLDLMHSKF